jgi:hypothetical protein
LCDDLGFVNLQRGIGKKLLRIGHQSLGDVPGKVSVLSAFIIEGIKNRVRAIVLLQAVPGDCRCF